MASKRTLNAKNLQMLGVEALAELLIEVSHGNAVIQRRLRLALAAAGGAEGAAQEVRKRLAAIARSTTFIDSARRKALLMDLEAQQQAITGPIASADPALAVGLQVRLLELSEGVLDRCSDSTGAVIGVFQRGVDGLASLAGSAGISTSSLVDHAAELLQENGYGQFEGLIPALAPLLGEAGLLQLEKTLRELVNLRPRGIREHLRLNRPIYVPTSAYGHFGREPDPHLDTFTWEKTDLVPALKSAFNR